MRRQIFLASLLLLGGQLFVTAETEQPYPDHFDDFEKAEPTLLASPAEGGVVALYRARNIFVRWDANGELKDTCTLQQIGFDSVETNVFAVAGDLAVVPTMVPGGNGTQGVKSFIVNLATCELRATFSLPQPVTKISRARDYWVAETLPNDFSSAPDEWSSCEVVQIDDDGKVQGALRPPKGLIERRRDHGRTGAPAFGRLIQTRRSTWVIPADRYEFWRPRQRGLGEYLLEVPECVFSENKEYKGDDAINELHERFGDSDPAILDELLAAAAESDAFAVQVPAVSSATSYGDYAAISVRTSTEHAPGCRVDLWDMSLEKLVFTQELKNRCNGQGFLALGDDVIWTLDGNSALRIELPPVLNPIESPCSE